LPQIEWGRLLGFVGVYQYFASQAFEAVMDIASSQAASTILFVLNTLHQIPFKPLVVVFLTGIKHRSG